ncbi:MAG: YbaK/EbsC family protein [Deltaproteobacteria bacterium]|nr:YbaK/EbsC family protein [Deltaproteobacteria bacterium]
MSVDNVRAFFSSNNLPYEIREFDTSTETVELAAQALGVEPALIAKTMALKLKDRNVLVVTKGVARIDNKKFKQVFQVKAKMMSPEEVLEMTGHPVGGVCPFGLKQEFEIYLDKSLKLFEKVYPAAGSKNSCIEITPQALLEITGAGWVDVCK